MTWFLLCLFGAVCAGMLLWGLREKGRIYEFPFLAGATLAGFALPQLIGLRHHQKLPEGALDKTILMVILCSSMCFLGYAWSNRPARRFNWTFDGHKLLLVSGALAAVGAYFFFAISRLPEDLTGLGLWTGLPVAYRFFAEVLAYGFAIAITLHAATGNRWALGLALFCALFYLDRIVLAGRRGVAIEFFTMVILAFWFGRRWILPRWLMLAAILGGVLALHSTGEYRSAVMTEDESKLRQIREITFVENLRRLLQEGGPEMENAAYFIAAADETGNFDFGLFHWNTLVFNYVPAQFVGERNKEALMAPVEECDLFVLYGHVPSTGSTVSGFVDAFGSFWYFGCLKFFVIAFVLRRLFTAAMEGHFVAQLLYMLMLPNALHTITHHTQWFISPWVHMGLFLFPAIVLARAQPSRFHRRPLALANFQKIPDAPEPA